MNYKFTKHVYKYYKSRFRNLVFFEKEIKIIGIKVRENKNKLN